MKKKHKNQMTNKEQISNDRNKDSATVKCILLGGFYNLFCLRVVDSVIITATYVSHVFLFFLDFLQLVLGRRSRSILFTFRRRDGIAVPVLGHAAAADRAFRLLRSMELLFGQH